MVAANGQWIDGEEQVKLGLLTDEEAQWNHLLQYYLSLEDQKREGAARQMRSTCKIIIGELLGLQQTNALNKMWLLGVSFILTYYPLMLKHFQISLIQYTTFVWNFSIHPC